MVLEDLYRDVIMDHFKRPRNQGKLADADVVAEGANPLCGDELTLWLKVEDGVVAEARFEGHGCSISQASTSIMTEAVKGKSLDEIEQLIDSFRAMMLEGAEADASLGDGVALEGVKKFPVRIKCAVLSWNTLRLGLAERAESGGAPVTSKHSET
jgi:nitrogen fixation NifU-like protein